MVEKEYIEREAALKANCYFCSAHLEDDSPCVEKCADYMKFIEIPAAAVRTVVLCKDCKYWNRERISCEGLARCNTGESGIRYRSQYDFCSRGEKREES